MAARGRAAEPAARVLLRDRQQAAAPQAQRQRPAPVARRAARPARPRAWEAPCLLPVARALAAEAPRAVAAALRAAAEAKQAQSSAEAARTWSTTTRRHTRKPRSATRVRPPTSARRSSKSDSRVAATVS